METPKTTVMTVAVTIMIIPAISPIWATGLKLKPEDRAALAHSRKAREIAQTEKAREIYFWLLLSSASGAKFLFRVRFHEGYSFLVEESGSFVSAQYELEA